MTYHVIALSISIVNSHPLLYTFLGARAPLELARVKKINKNYKEKVLNSNNLLYPASTSTLLLGNDNDSLR